jgi:uncharacterized membrane protein
MGAAPNPSAPPPPAGQAASMPNNTVGALCYLFGLITGIIFLVLEPYNRDKLVRFHAFQSIFMTGAVFVAHIVLTILALLMATVTFLLSSLIAMLHLLVSLAFFLLWLYMMWKTYSGEKVVLPIIGPLAEKQA